jgi:hypothetical protein
VKVTSVAFLQIEAAQQLPIEGQAIGVEGVGRAEETPKGRFRGGDLVAQASVRERAVADEVDGLNFGGRAFVDLEHQIDAVLVQLNDLCVDRRGKSALTAIEFEYALKVALHLGAGKDHPRPQLDLGLEDLVIDPQGDDNDEGVAVAPQGDVREQAGGEQAFQRRVDLDRIEGLAGIDPHVGAHGGGIHPLGALDANLLDDAPRENRLGLGRPRQKRNGKQAEGNNKP